MNNHHLVQTFIEGYLNTLHQDIAQEEARIIDVIREATDYVPLDSALSDLFASKKLEKLVQKISDEKRFKADGYFLARIAEGTLDEYDVNNYIEHTPPINAPTVVSPLSASETILAYIKEHNLKTPSPERLSGLAEEVEIHAAENALTFEEVLTRWKEQLERALA